MKDNEIMSSRATDDMQLNNYPDYISTNELFTYSTTLVVDSTLQPLNESYNCLVH